MYRFHCLTEKYFGFLRHAFLNVVWFGKDEVVVNQAVIEESAADNWEAATAANEETPLISCVAGAVDGFK